MLTSDPTNVAGSPYYGHTPFFTGLTVQAAAVPEPGTTALAGVALAMRRRQRQADQA